MATFLVLALCAGAASPGPAADRQALLDYLNAAADDFAVIDALLADTALDQLYQDTSSGGEEMTSEDIAGYLDVLKGYGSDIEAVLREINMRETPANQEIAYFREAELQEFEMANDIIHEFIQVLKYADSLNSVGEEMGKIGELDTADLGMAYQQIHDAITVIINKLKAETVPSFLKSMNDGLISAMEEFDDAVLYMMQAAALDDPVRESASEYRLGMLLRMLSALSEESEKDFAERGKKIQGDLKNIQTENDGMKNWVQQNIGRLNEN
jgi:hypothetical protein